MPTPPPPLLLACTDAPRISNVEPLWIAMPSETFSVLLMLPRKTAVESVFFGDPLRPPRWTTTSVT